MQRAFPSGDVFEPRSVLPSTAITSRASARNEAAQAAKPRCNVRVSSKRNTLRKVWAVGTPSAKGRNPRSRSNAPLAPSSTPSQSSAPHTTPTSVARSPSSKG